MTSRTNSRTACTRSPRTPGWATLTLCALLATGCIDGDGEGDADAGIGGSGGTAGGGTGATPGGGGGSTPTTGDAEVDALIEDAPAHQAFVEAHADAEHASGTWTMRGDSLEFTFGSSGFACDGPEEGETGTFTIVTLEGDSLTLDMEGDVMEFERVGGDDGDDGIVGTWMMSDSDFVLTFNADGSLVVSGAGGDCQGGDGDGDGDGDGGYFNGDGCYINDLPRQTAIEVDGRLEDWQADGVTGVQDEDPADATFERAAADISGVRIAASEDDLFILLETAERLDTSFQGGGGDVAGSYVISIRHDGGATYYLSLYYDPDAGAWMASADDEGGSYAVASADRALETRISWSTLGNPGQVYEIWVATQDCSSGSGDCAMWDTGPCFGEAN